MERSEVIAYLIMEAASEPTKPENIKVFDKSGLFYLRFDTVLQTFDTFNRNRRNYDSGAMKTSLFQASHLTELMTEGSWCGEAGHPDTEEVRRILTIDPQCTSHRITKIWMEGTVLYGTVETLDDNAHGTRFTKNILQGMTPAFSLRALASLTKRSDGSAFMKSRAHVVTYDRVILPSHKEAYRDKSKPIQTVSKRIPNDAVTEGVLIAVNENQIKDFIRLESVNVKAVSNVYEVATESMSVSEDFKFVYLKEGSNTYAVKVEDRIKNEVRGFMARL